MKYQGRCESASVHKSSDPSGVVRILKREKKELQNMVLAYDFFRTNKLN